jgi:hypothetical protein
MKHRRRTGLRTNRPLRQRRRRRTASAMMTIPIATSAPRRTGSGRDSCRREHRETTQEERCRRRSISLASASSHSASTEKPDHGSDHSAAGSEWQRRSRRSETPLSHAGGSSRIRGLRLPRSLPHTRRRWRDTKSLGFQSAVPNKFAPLPSGSETTVSICLACRAILAGSRPSILIARDRRGGRSDGEPSGHREIL